MPDCDKFDNPSYSSEQVEFEDEGIAGQAMEAIEPTVPMINAKSTAAAR